MIRITGQGGGASQFTIGPHRGVWRVTRDGAFYGDFPVRQSAVDAAQSAMLLPATRIRPAELLFLDEAI